MSPSLSLSMWLSQFMCLAGLHPFARQPALRQFEEDDRLRLVDLEKDRSVNVDADEDDPRIVGRAVARTSLLPEPSLPVGLVELADLVGVPRQLGDTRRRDPLIRSGLVVARFTCASSSMSRSLAVPSAVTNHRSAPAARFWFAMARDSRCPSGRRVVIIATLISSMRP